MHEQRSESSTHTGGGASRRGSERCGAPHFSDSRTSRRTRVRALLARPLPLGSAGDAVAALSCPARVGRASRSASIPGCAVRAPGCACRDRVTNVACRPESNASCGRDPGQRWRRVDDPGAREDSPPEVVPHDRQLDHVGTIGLRKRQAKAPAPGPHDVLIQEVPGRNPNQPQEPLRSTERSDRRSETLDTHVPIRVRPRRVTHHQLERVAAVGKRQRGIVCPQHAAIPGSQVVCTSVNVHAHHPSYKKS